MYAYRLGFILSGKAQEFKCMRYYSWLTYYCKDDDTR